MSMLSVRDLQPGEQRVLLRTDYNVETVGDHVLDDLRMRMSVPTIELLREQGARIAICSHRGRPHGKPNEEFSNSHLADHLRELVGAPIEVATDCIGDEVAQQIRELPPGGILLLENVRFYPEEEANDPEFAVALSQLADMYVDDAFGAIHRAHASIVGVPEHLPSAAGLLLEREVARLTEVAESPEEPVAVIVGGAKVADKLPLLEHLLPHAHVVCLGGAAANAVLQAQGLEIGASRVDPDAGDAAQRLLTAFEAHPHLNVVLPSDVVVQPGGETVSVNAIPADAQAVDLGPASIEAFREALGGARTVIWNGPLGIFEEPPFDHGTTEIAKLLAGLDARVVVGGGETAAAVRHAGVADQLWHVSTGGGAALQLLSGKALPGIEALERAAQRIPARRPSQLA
jgi:phosphoglycerate kinase